MTEKIPSSAEAPTPQTPDSSASKPDLSRIKVTKAGIWTIFIENKWHGGISWPTFEGPKEMLACLPYTFILLRQIAAMGILPIVLSLVSSFLGSVRPAADLYCSARLLDVIQQLVLQKDISEGTLTWIIGAKLLCIVVNWVETTINEWCNPILETRANRIFKEMGFKARLRLDLATSEDEAVKSKFAGLRETGWYQLSTIIHTGYEVIRVLSQMAFAISFFSKLEDGPLLALMCMAQPVLDSVFGDYWRWDSLWYARVENDQWSRMNAFRGMGYDSTFLKEIIGDGVSKVIEEEYYKAKVAVGDIAERDPYSSGLTVTQSISSLISGILQESPLLLLALRAYQNPSSPALTSLAMIQETTSALKMTIHSLYYYGTSVGQNLRSIKATYDLMDIPLGMKDGQAVYPPPDLEKPSQGMTVEFRNVSFKYPGKDKLALNDVSFTMKAGQLVIIVGENGSGKTSTVSLLNRMVDPTSGEIFIDGQPIKSYHLESLRRGSAILCQEYNHYPLTISENIGLGDPSNWRNEERIQKAAEFAGAKEIIEELPQKYETNLVPNNSTRTSWRPIEGTEVQKLMKEHENPPTKFSGGQWQRLALARTFMRAMADSVKLVCCDEPSAALDPRAEAQVFERLRTVVSEKTRIFITHRFGHLTKHADLILVMKDGSLEEQGTHADLMAKGGEYAKLYNIQADAFVN